jgi:hypothetical protein
MTLSVMIFPRTFTNLIILILTLICTAVTFPVCAEEYDADTVDVIDVQSMPWGIPSQGVPDKTSGNGTYTPTDFLNESEYQTHKRTIDELNQVLKSIYDRNPSYLSQLAIFKISPATRLFNSFVYNRGAFFIGAGLWNSLQTPDARAFMILNAITWKKNHGPDKARRIHLHSRIGVFPAGIPLALLSSGLSLPYNGWASYQAYKAYPNFIYKVDRLTIDQIKKLNYNPEKAMNALMVLDENEAFSFLDQPSKAYYEAQTGRSVYNPNSFRLTKQGFRVPRPENRHKTLVKYLGKSFKTTTP